MNFYLHLCLQILGITHINELIEIFLEKKYVCFNAVQKWDINLQDVVTLYQYQNCS